MLPDTFEFADPAIMMKVLPPGALQRWHEWEAVRGDLQSLGGHFLADLDHHPNTKCQGGSLYPTQATHSNVFSWHRARLATKMEGFAAHGLHVFPNVSGKLSSASVGVLKTLKPTEQAHLVGNSLLCPLVACWVAYCLSCVEPIEGERTVMCSASEPPPSPTPADSVHSPS
jgi:hypothetical protein